MADPCSDYESMCALGIPGIKARVVTEEIAWAFLKFAKDKGFALPAFEAQGPVVANRSLMALSSLVSSVGPFSALRQGVATMVSWLLGLPEEHHDDNVSICAESFMTS